VGRHRRSYGHVVDELVCSDLTRIESKIGDIDNFRDLSNDLSGWVFITPFMKKSASLSPRVLPDVVSVVNLGQTDHCIIHVQEEFTPRSALKVAL
jgi:hypothetical protein